MAIFDRNLQVSDDIDYTLDRMGFEQHCQRCHRLTFDDARPEKEALHGEPRDVYSNLVSVYQLDEGRMGSLRERRRSIVRRPGSDPNRCCPAAG